MAAPSSSFIARASAVPRRRIEDLHARRGHRTGSACRCRRIHVADAPRAQVLQPLADAARALARILQVVAHQAVEADVARAFAREQLAVRTNEVLRGEHLFGRDSFETQIGAQRQSPLQPTVTGSRAGAARRCSSATATMPIDIGAKHHNGSTERASAALASMRPTIVGPDDRADASDASAQPRPVARMATGTSSTRARCAPPARR